MPTRTPRYNFPIYDPAGADAGSLGLPYFNDLTGASPASLSNKLETILSNLESTKSTIHAKTTEQWAVDDVILKAGEWGLDTTRRALRVGDGDSEWSDLEDFLPALPILISDNEPTTETIGSLGQFYAYTGSNPKLFICANASNPYLWVSLITSFEFENFLSNFDSNGNGIVDNSERLGGQLPNYYLNTAQKGKANGIAELDTNSKVPASQLDLTATNAEISAINVKAENAQTSANAADGKAQSAQSAAGVAQSAANAAQESANAANAAAATAQTAANTAQQAANAANTNATRIKVNSRTQDANGNIAVRASHVPIDTISGLVSTQVQAALAEILGKIPALPVPPVQKGTSISIAATDWVLSGDYYQVTKTDSKVLAKTASRESCVMLNPTIETVENAVANIETKTNDSGGSYTLRTTEAPTGTLSFDVLIFYAEI